MKKDADLWRNNLVTNDTRLSSQVAGSQNITKQQALLLYLNFLRISRKIQNYNVASYIRRRARVRFEECKNLKDQAEFDHAYKFGLEQLKIAQLYQKINSFYDSRPSVVFNNKKDSYPDKPNPPPHKN